MFCQFCKVCKRLTRITTVEMTNTSDYLIAYYDKKSTEVHSKKCTPGVDTRYDTLKIRFDIYESK